MGILDLDTCKGVMRLGDPVTGLALINYPCGLQVSDGAFSTISEEGKSKALAAHQAHHDNGHLAAISPKYPWGWYLVAINDPESGELLVMCSCDFNEKEAANGAG